ncbi:saccharopine dehydrogenase [Paenibacillaceae bacterium]|nr:saccharopine dehydrogenase [Paenibacillaceae bacterium]
MEETVKDNIIVVGGYGHVGRTLCEELGDRYPGKVYAAGRSMKRAEQLSASSGGKVKPMQLDISKPADPNMLASAKLVIMCLDQTETDFVRACLEAGTNYMDVSAQGDFLEQVERLAGVAERNGATALLSIGLAPGLTNVLAKAAYGLLDETTEIDISIMLGLGDQHGKAAIEWTVDNLNAQFPVMLNNRQSMVNSFEGGKRIDFGRSLGQKKSYRFPFSDQQTLARTLSVPSVSTRLCFDSAAATALMAGLRSSGAVRLLKTGWIRSAAVAGFGKLRLGSEQFAVKVDAWGSKSGRESRAECLLVGNNQSRMTALTAIFVADALYRKEYPNGVFHIEQLFGISDMKNWIEREAELTINGE